MADKACDTCVHFDHVLRGTGGAKGTPGSDGKAKPGHRETNWGWCAKKSVYPAQEEPGQRFPAGVKRHEDPNSLAKPFIVKKGQVVANCNEYQARKTGMVSKVDLLKKLREQSGNKIPG